MKKGIWYGISAYLLWGSFPLYWKQLHHVPALQLISHRILWSFLILTGIILATGQWRAFRAATRKPRALKIYSIAGVLIALNWTIYVWAVNAGYIIETSLGYFINPLVSVLLGVIILHERLRAWQWVAVGLAGGGVLYLTLAYGALPWTALALAFTFGTYGLLKKIAPLGPLHGMTLETGFVLLPAIVFLLRAAQTGSGAFLHTGAVSDALMIGGGLVTTIPLLLFAAAMQRIPLSLMGILQYISPTLQFLIGVLVYREAFSRAQFVGFGLVWMALILFTVEGIVAGRGSRSVPLSDL